MKTLLSNLSSVDTKFEKKITKPSYFQISGHSGETTYKINPEMSFEEISELISSRMFEVLINSKTQTDSKAINK